MNDKETESDSEPFEFGKHKGLTPNQIAEEDPGWLVWAYENIKQKRAYGFPICSRTLYLACKDERDDSQEEDETPYDLYEDSLLH